MPLIQNQAKAKLEAGELALGMGVRITRSVEIAKIAKVSGFDWLFIDMEHGAMSVDSACQISVAALDAGVTPIVRTPGHEHFHATRVLDGGAQGVVVPHVSTVESARQVADNCRYPPVGHRSLAGSMAQLEYEALAIGEAAKLINANTLVTVMLETPEAIENADAIAAVAGIDVLLIGTNDLCAEMGIHGQFGHERVAKAYERVIAACRNNRKHPGMGGVYDQELSSKYIKMGARFLLAGADLSLMMTAAKARTQFLRQISR